MQPPKHITRTHKPIHQVDIHGRISDGWFALEAGEKWKKNKCGKSFYWIQDPWTSLSWILETVALPKRGRVINRLMKFRLMSHLCLAVLGRCQPLLPGRREHKAPQKNPNKLSCPITFDFSVVKQFWVVTFWHKGSLHSSRVPCSCFECQMRFFDGEIIINCLLR